MRFLYFPGCTIPYRQNAYEASAKAVARVLGVELVTMRQFNCCGLNTEAVDQRAALLLAARNLAIAEESGLDLVTLCSGCYKTLSVANATLKGGKDKVNKALAKIGRNYSGSVDVLHFFQVLVSQVGYERISQAIVHRFQGLKVATHVGCHAIRPSQYVSVDDAEAPIRLDRLVRLTGAETTDYLDKNGCCGAPLLAVSERLGMEMGREAIWRMKEAGAEAVVCICPFCHIMFDVMQAKMQEEFGERYELPSIYLTQLLGLAMGLEPEAVGLQENQIRCDEIVRLWRNSAAF